MAKELTGRFPVENILSLEVPRPPEGVIETFSSLGGIVCLISDVFDTLGLTGVLPASLLGPVFPGRSIAGPALTIRKVRLRQDAGDAPRKTRGDIEAHNLTTPGDILVIQGDPILSNMGGISALTGKRQGSLGAIIWGGCRDVAELREMDYPIWSTAVTPITGVGRIDSEIINGEVEIGGHVVRCGDIIVADDDGVCIVPHDRAAEVADLVRKRAAADERRVRLLKEGMPLPELARL
jgi:regulator of RNase E activity RraA